jgi:ribonuclease inhibitor
MTNLKLDFSTVKHFMDIHKVLKETFDFPDFYGENLDALWDCMRDYCEYNLHIVVVGFEHFPDEWKEYMSKIFEVFNDVHDECSDFTYEISDS